ncbi:MAG TPA: PQQ-dependent sugar dehydrogenase, partial [Candidatus Cybelea sp.]|nr:PQQ-dependent sugar dehydrogenase [Candidatus Cybelea sp.]
MRHLMKFGPGLLLLTSLRASLLLCGAFAVLSQSPAQAQQKTAPNQSDVDNAPADLPAVAGRLPDQAHVMVDVGYHFANLWFAADKQNWPLANYYLGETRSNLRWAVRIRPTRKNESGANVDLNGILEAVDNTMLAEVEKAIQNKDVASFKTAYRRTIEGCYACHAACEKPFLRVQVPDAPSATILNFSAPAESSAANPQTADANRGKIFFQQNCALCHATKLGPGNTAISGQGPSLVAVFGQSAGTSSGFNFTKALSESRLTWDAATLDRFLSNPTAAVPGTSMPIPVPSAENRRNVIAFLSTLTAPAGFSRTAPITTVTASDAGDWHHDAQGVKHYIKLAALPAPYSTTSAGNNPKVVSRPAEAGLSVPPHFTAGLFQGGLSGPRLLRVAPNGDIFIAETRESRIRILRAADGAEAPSQNEIFADDLDRPFGIAFYPPGPDPQWIYVANNNSVVRFAYRNGDLKARGEAQVIVASLTQSRGGHSTRDVIFSKDGKRMFISVGSGSNAAEEMNKKSEEAIRLWEAEHGRGAAWDAESNRANILVTDPEGHEPARKFATGVRNGAVMAVDKNTGELWVSTNERDALGDDLVPDYITHVKEGGFYGWPWYYL